jgi:hypothetical protein
VAELLQLIGLALIVVAAVIWFGTAGLAGAGVVLLVVGELVDR